MAHVRGFYSCLGLVFTCLTAVHCTSMSRANLPKDLTLQFKGEAGRASETRYYSNARILTYTQAQLVKDRLEAADFTVRNTVTAIGADKSIAYTSKTIRKDGTGVDLHDLAFPELGESVDFKIRPDGRVISAGRYPPTSVFFVPSLPIPSGPVTVGDTWDLEHIWHSARDGIPLKLEITAILKGIVPCYDHVCADLEISGHVVLPDIPQTISSRFDSKVWGRALFDVDRGDMIWSEMRSREEMTIQGERVRVDSCIISEMKVAKASKVKFECDPKEQAVSAVPKF